MTRNSGGVRDSLTKAAKVFVKQMKQNLSSLSGKLPADKIKSAIIIHAPAEISGTAFIVIEIDLEKAPMARAYEFGSGIHSTEGDKKRYRIPKLGGSSYVAFPKEKWAGYNPPPPAPDVFVFTHVLHPGVAPQPYMIPALEASKEKIRKILGKEFVASVVGVNRGKVVII